MHPLQTELNEIFDNMFEKHKDEIRQSAIMLLSIVHKTALKQSEEINSLMLDLLKRIRLHVKLRVKKHEYSNYIENSIRKEIDTYINNIDFNKFERVFKHIKDKFVKCTERAREIWASAMATHNNDREQVINEIYYIMEFQQEHVYVRNILLKFIDTMPKTNTNLESE
jgi:hypothetical protein